MTQQSEYAAERAAVAATPLPREEAATDTTEIREYRPYGFHIRNRAGGQFAFIFEVDRHPEHRPSAGGRLAQGPAEPPLQIVMQFKGEWLRNVVSQLRDFVRRQNSDAETVTTMRPVHAFAAMLQWMGGTPR